MIAGQGEDGRLDGYFFLWWEPFTDLSAEASRKASAFAIIAALSNAAFGCLFT